MMAEASVLDRSDFDRLPGALIDLGYQPVGPILDGLRIVYGPIASGSDMPVGKTDLHDGGMYRLVDRADEALFGFNLPGDSWKQYLFPPRALMWAAERADGSFAITQPEEEPPRYALFGVRACELAAIAIQDRVFTGGSYTDPRYRSIRDRVLIVGVNCVEAGGTCFCASMGTGPTMGDGYDLVITELLEDGHRFLISSGSPAGTEVLDELPVTPATAEDLGQAETVLAAVGERMGREIETAGLKELLYASAEHPRWDNVASRCLACANCTMVCPTCFCFTTEDRPTLDGGRAERWRTWDSCFSLGHSYIHGGPIRTSTRARYRQWMTHKLATWIDQFGSSGCVGCGRCITWCPVGIDITQEVRALRTEEVIRAHR